MNSITPPDIGLAALMLLLGATAVLLAGYFGFEAWALLTGHMAITDYARALQTHKPFLLLGGVAVFFLSLGILLGHFWA